MIFLADDPVPAVARTGFTAVRLNFFKRRTMFQHRYVAGTGFTAVRLNAAVLAITLEVIRYRKILVLIKNTPFFGRILFAEKLSS